MYDSLKNILDTTAGFITTILAIVITVVAWYRLFEKAGVEGWKAFIPIYNIYCYYYIATGGINAGLWFLGTFLLGWIPFVGKIVTIISYLYINYNFAKKYTTNEILVLLHLIPTLSSLIKLILAFGDYDFNSYIKKQRI